MSAPASVVVLSGAATVTRRVRRYGPVLVLALGLIFLGSWTLTTLPEPGLQYDELLFVNAALGDHYPWQGFINARVLGVPTMLMPYIGALKAWLFAPVFSIFGVSSASIRAPMVVVVALSVGVTFVLVRRLLGSWFAALASILLATDPAFGVMAKADWGPVGLAGLLRVTALLALFSWLRTARVRWLCLLLGTIGAGVFNKVDYLSFFAALAVATAAVHHGDARGALGSGGARAAAACVAFACFLGLLYVEVIRPAESVPYSSRPVGPLQRVADIWHLFTGTSNGTFLYDYFTTRQLSQPTLFTPMVVLVLLGAVATAAWHFLSARTREGRLADVTRVTVFFLVLFAVMGIALAATPQVVGPHHIIDLWPIPYLLAVSLVAVAWALPARTPRKVATVVSVGALALVALSQVATAETFRSAFAAGTHWRTMWTTEIYPVARVTRRLAPSADTVLTADWGIGTQLFALGNAPARERFADGWVRMAKGSAADRAQTRETTFRGKRVIVVLHAPGAEVMPHTWQRAQALVQDLKPRHGIHILYGGRALVALAVDDRR
jgi:hypothetical protein